MKIKTKDDKKGRHQSWSAEIDSIDMMEGSIFVNPGFGWTEDEAVKDLKENIRLIHLKWSSVVADTLMN